MSFPLHPERIPFLLCLSENADGLYICHRILKEVPFKEIELSRRSFEFTKKLGNGRCGEVRAGEMQFSFGSGRMWAICDVALLRCLVEFSSCPDPENLKTR